MTTSLRGADAFPGVRGSVPVVDARAASVTFTRHGTPVSALVEATFQLRTGDTVAVQGPSGSGKSTLLHLVAGLVRPTDGEIAWPALDGTDATRARRRHIGVVFQSPSLVPALTVVENVELPLLLHDRLPQGEARERALHLLADLGLADLAHTLPDQISGGQAQRVAVARVVALRPHLICADEPTGRLDRAHADAVLDLLLHAAARLGAPLLVSTHDPRIAERLGTAWPILDGRLLQESR